MRAWMPVCVMVLGLGMGAAATAGAESLKGVVADTTGAPLADVRVAVRDVATGQVIEVTTGADGRYDVSVPAAG